MGFMRPPDLAHVQHLALAVRLALGNAERGQPPFGALLVRDGQVLGFGVNTVPEDRDPTAHAEVNAIRAAWQNRDRPDAQLADAVLVSSAEPCPMCRAVAALVGIERIVYAADRESAAAVGFVLNPVAAALRERLGEGPPTVEQVPIAGADKPFRRFAEMSSRATLPLPAAESSAGSPVRELRLALTVADFAAAAAFYRDALGLPVVDEWHRPTGDGLILDAGRATLELLSPDQAALVDEVEVGRRVAGPIRVALEVNESVAAAERLEAAGAVRLGGPVVTPWSHRNVRLEAPAGLQLTLFTVLPEAAEDDG